MQIALTALQPSPTNPRKIFNEEKLIELAGSLQSPTGQLAPLVVRPATHAIVDPEKLEHGHEQYYEIVCGERRYRAALLAELASLECSIRNLDDRAVLEAQIIENNQREDVHPLEECEGFARILALPEYKSLPEPVQTLAEKIGKSKSYVYQRLKLDALCPEAKADFLAGYASAGHYIIIARLQPKDQYDTLTWLLWESRWNGEMMIRTTDRSDEAAIPSVRKLADYVVNNKCQKLEKATFHTTKPLISLPQVPACTECPKRNLEGDEGGDLCMHPQCFRNKTEAHVREQVARLKDKGVEPLMITGSWSSVTKGVLGSREYSTGKKSDAGAVAAIDAKTGQLSYVVPARGPSSLQRTEEEERKEKEARAARKAEILNIKVESAARLAAWAHIDTEFPRMHLTPHLRRLLEGLAGHFMFATNTVRIDAISEAAGFKPDNRWDGKRHTRAKEFLAKLDHLELLMFFVQLAICEEQHYTEYNKPTPWILEAVCDIAGLDLEILRADARADLTAPKKRKAKEEVQTSAPSEAPEDFPRPSGGEGGSKEPGEGSGEPTDDAETPGPNPEPIVYAITACLACKGTGDMLREPAKGVEICPVCRGYAYFTSYTEACNAFDAEVDFGTLKDLVHRADWNAHVKGAPALCSTCGGAAVINPDPNSGYSEQCEACDGMGIVNAPADSPKEPATA